MISPLQKYNAQDIHAHLKQDHKDWYLPERRVAKFTKRLKAGTPISDADEEKSVMSQGSLGGSLGRLFSSRKTVEKNETPTAPPTPEKLPENISIDKTEETDMEPKMEPKELELAYADDNDGKKEMGCWFCTF